MAADRDGLSSRVEGLLAAAVRAGTVPGAVAAWSVGDGPTMTVAAGSDSVLGTGRPTDAATWYDLASLTKPLAAGSLAMVAVAEGRLGLDTRVRDILPDAVRAPMGDRTVVHLLTHSSGLPAWAPVYALARGERSRATGAVLGIPLESAPGARVCYSCLGFLLLGAMLERVFDQPLDRTFESRVGAPLRVNAELRFRPDVDGVVVARGAETSRVEQDLTTAAGMDAGFVPARRHGEPDDGNARFLDGVAANAGLFGTAAGVVMAARMFLDGGGLFDPELAAVARRNWTPGLDQSRGLAWQLAGTPGSSAGPWLPATAYGHTGFTGTSVWVDPERRLTIALLSNRLHPGGRQADLHPLRRALHRIVVSDVERH